MFDWSKPRYRQTQKEKTTLAFEKKENQLYKPFICDLKPGVKQSFPLCSELNHPCASNFARFLTRLAHLSYFIPYVICYDRVARVDVVRINKVSLAINSTHTIVTKSYKILTFVVKRFGAF